jgi:hypothetical protein
MIQKKPKMVADNVPGSPFVQSAKRTEPILGRGEYQDPQNNITPNTLTNSIMPYSDKNSKAQRIPAYSV